MMIGEIIILATLGMLMIFSIFKIVYTLFKMALELIW